MDDSEFEQWVSLERAKVESYLEAQGIENATVGPWPAFDVAPKFAIWPVESNKFGGRIGWWAFSGDCPTDYVSEDGNCHPRHALALLLERWRGYLPYMRRGEQPPDAEVGDPSNLPTLARLLEGRIAILSEWWLDDDLWTDQ